MGLKYFAGLLALVYIAVTGSTCNPSGTAVKLAGNVIGLDGELRITSSGESIVVSGSRALSYDTEIFMFSTEYYRGQEYSVQIETQPEHQVCAVSNGNGVFGAASVFSVEVACYPEILPGTGGVSQSKLVFSPPWYITGHDEALFSSQWQQLLESKNLDFYQVWKWHLDPGPTQMFYENTFAYQCELVDILEGNCVRYNYAVDSIGNTGAELSIEMGPNYPINGPGYNGYLMLAAMAAANEGEGANREDACSSQTNAQAKYYGEALAQRFFEETLHPWIMNGGTIGNISFDGWVLKMTKEMGTPDEIPRDGGCGFENVQLAVIATVAAAVELRRNLVISGQDTELSLLVNLPNWKYKGMPSVHNQDTPDYEQVLSLLAFAAAGSQFTFDGLVIDNPYNYLVVEGDPAESIQTLERLDGLIAQAEVLELKVNFITNTNGENGHIALADYPFSYDIAANYRYKLESIIFQDVLRFRYGARIDRYVAESWHSDPFHYEDMYQILDMFDQKLKAGNPIKNENCSYYEYLVRRPDVIADRGLDREGVINHYNNFGINEGACTPY